MKAFGHMVFANLKMTIRNRMALFWLLAFPVIFIVLFGYLIGSGEFSMSIGVVGADQAPQAARVVDEMRAIDGFEVTAGSEEAELAALQDGDRDIVLVFGPGPQADQITAAIYYDQSNPQESQVAVAAIRQFLSAINQELTNAPQAIITTEQGISTQSINYIDFLVPGILAMSIMNSGIIGLSSIFVSYRERGILRRIKATPFPLGSFILARILTQVLVAVAQAVILLTIAKVLFDLTIVGDYLSLLVMVILGALAFLAIGFLISGVARNQEAADGMSNAIAFPMMFLSGIFFPVEMAPTWLRPITQAMPLTYLANALRDIMVHGNTLVTVWLNVIVMLVTTVIALLLAVRFFRWEARAT